MATPREQLADMLRQCRIDAGYGSHGALARKLNVSRPVITKAENAAHPVPSDALLAAWGGTMESTDLNWRKASYSSNGGAECVEIGGTLRTVLVRDTQDRTGPMLRFSSDPWRRFTSQVKTRA